MVGYWVSFGMLAVAFFFGVISFKSYAFKHSSVPITPEIKKRANIRAAKLIAFYWLCDLFYMSLFIKNIVCQYIFGGLIMIIIFANLAKSFSTPKDKNGFQTFGLIQDFAVGIALTVYLIYIIPNSEVQTIVIPIVAAVYGGLITLVGVSLQVKKSEKDRKEDELKKAKPVFSYNMIRKEPILNDVIQKVCISDSLESDVYSCEAYVELENSNLSSFILRRILHDNCWVAVEGNTVVLPSTKCLLSFRFSDYLEPIYLEVEDVLNNKHLYRLKVLRVGSKSSSGKQLYTIREIDPAFQDEIIAASNVKADKNPSLQK